MSDDSTFWTLKDGVPPLTAVAIIGLTLLSHSSKQGSDMTPLEMMSAFGAVLLAVGLIVLQLYEKSRSKSDKNKDVVTGQQAAHAFLRRYSDTLAHSDGDDNRGKATHEEKAARWYKRLRSEMLLFTDPKIMPDEPHEKP